MKTNIITLSISILTLLAFAPKITAQNACSKFYHSEQGKTWVIHQFDKRDKLSTITSYTLKEVAQGESGTILTIAMKLVDGKNNKELTTVEFKAICNGNTTKLDPGSLVAPGIFDQYKDMDYSITGSGLSFPNELNVGENLPGRGRTHGHRCRYHEDQYIYSHDQQESGNQRKGDHTRRNF